jgi:mono/diheme cytochrome c family protein
VNRRILPLLGFVLAAMAATLAGASEPVLTIDIGGTTRSFARGQLLKSPEAVEIDVPHDNAYGGTMHYRAIPLDRLLAGVDLPRAQILEAVASDGFIGMLPVDLVLRPPPGGTRAYLAIEPADAPWPPLKGNEASAGPFYIVWLNPEAAGIHSEQWPYKVVAIRSADSPAKRWPALDVAPSLPADDPVRAGQTLFVIECLACHKMNGAGSADVGPDLNRPENPTEYFQESALKRYIRDPASLRHWPKMGMKAFNQEQLREHEIDMMIANLQHMDGRKESPRMIRQAAE